MAPAGGRGEDLPPLTRQLVARIGAVLSEDMPEGADPMAEARRRAGLLFRSFDTEARGTPGEDLTVQGAEGSLPARLYRCGGEDERATLTLFLHGGGWSLGGIEDYDGLVRALAEEAGLPILSLGYRLAPEHPFPAGLDDTLAACRDAAARAEGWGFRPNRIALMGDSAGGNLAAAAAGELLGSPSGLELAGQFLLYPMLDVSVPHEAYPSRLLFGGGEHFLTREAIDGAVAGYLPTGHEPADPKISPLHAKVAITDTPTVLMVGECDPLRDEALAYAEKLRAAGRSCIIDVVPGAIHGFLSFGILPEAQEGRRRLAAEMRRILIM
jgi:acetyl esterase